MKAVILAAGQGVRLLPLTATRPKPLIKVGGKPILEHCLDALKKAGITEALIVTNYLSKAIREYFGAGQKFGFKLDYVEQPSTLGTGNAAGIAEPYVDGSFILVYGDLLFSQDVLKNLIQVFETQNPNAVMAVTPVGKPENFGIVELENNLKIKQLIEKPAQGETQSNLERWTIRIQPRDFQNSQKAQIFGSRRNRTHRRHFTND